MFSNILTSGLLSILGVFAVSGFQYSALQKMTEGTQFTSTRVRYSHIDQTIEQIIENDIEKKNEQLKTMMAMPSIGFRNMWANSAFVQFLQYFGDDEARKHSDYDQSPEFLKVALSRDPYYTKFYMFLSGSTTIYAGQPQETVDIMKSSLDQIGNKRADDNYLAWRYKAVDELLFLGDSEAAQKSFAMAANWAFQSNNKNSEVIAKVSQQTVQFLSNNPDSKQAQINAWSSILTTALDDETRSRAIRSIQALGGEVIINENGAVTVQYAQGG